MSNMQNYGAYWWKAPKNEVYREVFDYIHHLDREQEYRDNDNLRYARLYGNYEILGLDTYSYSRAETSYNTNRRVSLNIVQSMIDTIVSKITKNKPRPMFLTSGGDWSEQTRAKQLTKFCEGVFSSCGLYDEGARAFIDACIFGTGCVKFIQDGEKIKAERVFINEIKVDDVEAYYGKPRQIHQVKWIHKEVLKAEFPNKKVEIESASSDSAKYSRRQGGFYEGMIKVVESWRLPNGKESQDGRHAISIQNCTLVEQPYEKHYFPFVFYRWTKRPVGFFGQGVAEQLTGIQLEINKLLRVIQVSMHLVSIPKIFVDASSKIVSAHLNNKIGGVIKFSGTPPILGQALGNIPPELFSQLDRLYNRAYEIVGVSQLSSQGSKPSGLNSGKALRAFNDIETERFYTVGRDYEKSFMDAAEIIIDMAKDIYKYNPDFSVRVRSKNFAETIKWKDVNLEQDKYIMDVFPTNALSTHPSSRLQDIEELMQAGLISPKQGKKLLDFPDLEAVMDFEVAAEDDIMRVIEGIIDSGTYETPEPYQDLDFGIQAMQQAYLYYRAKKAPEERLELFRRWIEDANDLLQRAQNPQPPIGEELPQTPEEAQAQAAMLAQQGAPGAAEQVLENQQTAAEIIADPNQQLPE